MRCRNKEQETRVKDRANNGALLALSLSLLRNQAKWKRLPRRLGHDYLNETKPLTETRLPNRARSRRGGFLTDGALCHFHCNVPWDDYTDKRSAAVLASAYSSSHPSERRVVITGLSFHRIL